MTWPWTRGTRPSDVPGKPCPPPVDLFDFLEDDLTGRPAPTGPASSDQLLARALEVANDDWPEHDAVRELARLAAGNRLGLQRAHRRLQLALLRNPVPDITGVRASRVVLAALRAA
jgi:hypothetical protein